TLERSLRIGAPPAAGAGERPAGPAADRRGVDVAQHLGERTARDAFDLEAGVVAELRDHAVDPGPVGAAETGAGVADLEPGAIDDQLARHRGQRGPGRVARLDRMRAPRLDRDVGEDEIVDLGI